MTTTVRRTPGEIAELKCQWERDPCWDIEDTEGFEAHRDELLAFRQEHEERSRRNYKRGLMPFAAKIGLADNLPLAEYIQGLEREIHRLRGELLG